MTNYLKKSDFDQSKFYMMYQTMFTDDRIMEDKRGGHTAVILYGGIQNKISLSESTHKKQNDPSFMTADGQYYCVYPVKTALQELKIKRTKYNEHKALLKETGLIHFEEQENKKSGFASQITYTPWEVWVKKNGLYSDGEWIVQPSSEDFYNPKDIVTVQPIIAEPETEAIEQESIPEETSEETHQEYENIMTEAKKLALKFHRSERMDELDSVVKKYFGNKRFLDSTVKDLNKLRLCYEQMKRTFNHEGELPDF